MDARAYMHELLQIIFSPEYGAEAIKVGAAYLMFRSDIKKLGKQLKDYIASNNRRVFAIEHHLGINSPQDGAEGDNNG